MACRSPGRSQSIIWANAGTLFMVDWLNIYVIVIADKV